MHYLRGHPHSKNKQREGGGVQPSAYDCVQGGGGGGEGEISRWRTYAKKIFWSADSQNFFFCTKEAIIIVYRQVQTGFKL